MNKRGRKKTSSSQIVNHCQQHFDSLSMSKSRDNDEVMDGVVVASNLSGSLHYLIKIDSENGEYGNF